MFGRSKKRKSGGSRGLRRLPKRVLAPVEEIVEQGLLVADVAVRMTVKNAIIMNALKRNVDYDEVQIRDMVRASCIDLAEEREHDATHISRMRGEIRDTGRSSWSESDYGNDDNRTLRHRQEVYEGVAAELRERAADPKYLETTAEKARKEAWREVGPSLADRAEQPYYSGIYNEEYGSERENRIQQLIEKDLTGLIRAQADKAAGRTGEDGAGDGLKKRIFKRKERPATDS